MVSIPKRLARKCVKAARNLCRRVRRYNDDHVVSELKVNPIVHNSILVGSKNYNPGIVCYFDLASDFAQEPQLSEEFRQPTQCEHAKAAHTPRTKTDGHMTGTSLPTANPVRTGSMYCRKANKSSVDLVSAVGNKMTKVGPPTIPGNTEMHSRISLPTGVGNVGVADECSVVQVPAAERSGTTKSLPIGVGSKSYKQANKSTVALVPAGRGNANTAIYMQKRNVPASGKGDITDESEKWLILNKQAEMVMV
ncbi:hypothetical protein BDQ17DRAFT_1329609 [Cyathus striatus]|nr:hypothetical protein BDQ17DRAFT_1329609 [Cyathus striatus]